MFRFYIFSYDYHLFRIAFEGEQFLEDFQFLWVEFTDGKWHLYESFEQVYPLLRFFTSQIGCIN